MNMHRFLDGRTIGFMVRATSFLWAAAAAASVLGLLPGVAGLSCLIGPVAPANAAVPVMPLVTAHHHFE